MFLSVITEYECEEDNDPMKTCVAVECTVEISHNERVTDVQVKYAMLSMKERIYAELTFSETAEEKVGS